MVNRNYIKVFRDKNLLNKMLSEYDNGERLVTLSNRYKVDHSSIIYQVKKNKGFVSKKFTKTEKHKNGDFCEVCEMKLSSPHHTVPCL